MYGRRLMMCAPRCVGDVRRALTRVVADILACLQLPGAGSAGHQQGRPEGALNCGWQPGWRLSGDCVAPAGQRWETDGTAAARPGLHHEHQRRRIAVLVLEQWDISDVAPRSNTHRLVRTERAP